MPSTQAPLVEGLQPLLTNTVVSPLSLALTNYIAFDSRRIVVADPGEATTALNYTYSRGPAQANDHEANAGHD